MTNFEQKLADLSDLVNRLPDQERAMVRDYSLVRNRAQRFEVHKALRQIHRTMHECRMYGYSGETDTKLDQAILVAKLLDQDHLMTIMCA